MPDGNKGARDDGGGADAESADAQASGPSNIRASVDPAAVGAGIVASAAVEQPGIAALPQQVVASPQDIAAGVAVLEQGQGQRHPMGQQHMPMEAQPGGAAFTVAQLPPCPSSGLGTQIQQNAPAPSQLAAATAVTMVNARLAADALRSLAGTKHHTTRGSLLALRRSSRLKSWVSFSRRRWASLLPLQNNCGTYRTSRLKTPPPPAPAMENPREMPAGMHFRAFIVAFAVVLKHGMGSAPDICMVRVVLLKQELNDVLPRLLSYLHFR